MIHRLIFVIFACAGMLLSSGSMAGQDRWTPIGPVGAPLTYIAADPRVASTLYASDGQHLFKSTDTGTTWRATLALPTSFEVTVTSSLCPTSYFVHPANGAIFATSCYGLFRSLDGGDSWQTLSAPSTPFSVVGGDPHDGTVVYGLITTFDPNNAEAVKSTNSGLTWVSLGNPSPNGGVTSIVVDALQPQVLYAVGGDGVFRSTDGGAHWAAANIGLPLFADVTSLVQIGTKLVVGLYGGVFVSTDQAATWSPSITGLTDRRVVALVASPGSVSPLYLLSGLPGSDPILSGFRSVDDGATWTPTGLLVFGRLLLAGSEFPLAAGPPPYVFATTSTGLAISNDAEQTWHPVSTGSGLPNVPTRTMLVDSSNPILYAATYFSVGYRSSDRGTHWNELGLFDDLGLSVGSTPLPQAVSPTRTGVVYGLSNDLVRSTDYGDNWVDLFVSLQTDRNGFQMVRESTTDPNRIVVGGNNFFTAGINIFYYRPVLIETSDLGETWQDISAGLPAGRVGLGLGAVAIDPTDEQTMYASVDDFVYKTINGGNLWVSMSSDLSAPVADIAINPVYPNIVYVATAPPQANYSGATAPVQPSNGNVGGLYVSFDGGATWTFNPSLGHVALTTLALDPHQPTTLYAGSNGQGVFRSSDAGQTWTAISDGLTTLDALRTRMLAVDPLDTRNLYVATDAGAFALTVANPGRMATVIEYYAPQFDDYFITPGIGEIQVLDTQVIPGWYRTGYSFEAYVEPAPGANPLCRFYIPPASHFFSGVSAECAAVLAVNVPPFVLESLNSFYLPVPDMTTGACAAGLIPVYRLYNNKPTVANHRYTTDLAVKAQMVAKGYIAEGYGPNAVIMCAPP